MSAPAPSEAAGADAPLGDGTALEDQQRFRRLMAQFATGITVVTTTLGGTVWGMTANAFMAGSLVPPLCVVAVGKQARMHERLRDAGRYGVAILSKEQWHLSNHFAGRPLAGTEPEFAYLGDTPVVARAVAALAADVVDTAECGDHTLFIGRIVHLEVGDAQPLLFHGGRYATIERLPRIEDITPPEFW